MTRKEEVTERKQSQLLLEPKSQNLKKLKFKKILSKIKNAADEAFRHEEQESSDEESLPDSRTMKIKAANSNKGPYDFDQLRLAQDLGREHAGAVWTMKFSPCGRLLVRCKVMSLWLGWRTCNHKVGGANPTKLTTDFTMSLLSFLDGKII